MRRRWSSAAVWLSLARILLSQVDFGVWIIGSKRVHVGEAKIAGAIAAKAIISSRSTIGKHTALDLDTEEFTAVRHQWLRLKSLNAKPTSV